MRTAYSLKLRSEKHCVVFADSYSITADGSLSFANIQTIGVDEKGMPRQVMQIHSTFGLGVWETVAELMPNGRPVLENGGRLDENAKTTH